MIKKYIQSHPGVPIFSSGAAKSRAAPQPVFEGKVGEYVFSKYAPSKRSTCNCDECVQQRMLSHVDDADDTSLYNIGSDDHNANPWYVCEIAAILPAPDHLIEIGRYFQYNGADWVVSKHKICLGMYAPMALIMPENVEEIISAFSSTQRHSELLISLENTFLAMVNALTSNNIGNINNISYEYSKLMNEISMPAKTYGTMLKLFYDTSR